MLNLFAYETLLSQTKLSCICTKTITKVHANIKSISNKIKKLTYFE